MTIERAKEYLRKYGLEDRVQEFDVSSATVELAAKALGCEPALIAKTMSFMVKEKPVVVVLAGDVKIDNSKFKQEFETKAKMLKYEEVEELIGYAVGGVCPFGVNEGVDIYLDESLKRFTTVYPACGSSNSAVKITVEELQNCLDYKRWVDIAKLA